MHMGSQYTENAQSNTYLSTKKKSLVLERLLVLMEKKVKAWLEKPSEENFIELEFNVFRSERDVEMSPVQYFKYEICGVTIFL